MRINNIGYNNTFTAKIVQNHLMKSAIKEAKKGSDAEKMAFCNALDLIHNDFSLKSFELKKSIDCKLCTPKHIAVITYNDNYVNTYGSPVSGKLKEEGQDAIKSLFNFIKEYYGKRMLQFIQTNILPGNTDLNEKIDNILKANSYRYML